MLQRHHAVDALRQLQLSRATGKYSFPFSSAANMLRLSAFFIFVFVFTHCLSQSHAFEPPPLFYTEPSKQSHYVLPPLYNGTNYNRTDSAKSSSSSNIRTFYDDPAHQQSRVPPTRDAEDFSYITQVFFDLLPNLFGGLRSQPSSYSPQLQHSAGTLYDAIVIGGGAAGCPLARTLADSGKNVLLIERGGSRKENPETLDVYGAGRSCV